MYVEGCLDFGGIKVDGQEMFDSFVFSCRDTPPRVHIHTKQRTGGRGLREAVEHVVLPLAGGRLVAPVARPGGHKRCVYLSYGCGRH